MASQVANGTTAANIKPSSRISATCITCRARKVRCDGRRGVCGNCQRLGFSCSYDDDSGFGGGPAGTRDSPSAAGQSPPKRRVRQACLNCHARKARCSGTTPRCHRCEAQGIACVYRPGRRPGAAGSSLDMAAVVAVTASGRPGQSEEPQSDHSRSLSSDRTSVPSPHPRGRRGRARLDLDLDLGLDDSREPLVLRTFDSFFRHVHHVPAFSFLHRASLMRRYHAGHVDRPLLLALVGITSLLTDPGGGTAELGARCILEAEASLLRELDRPSTLRLQALVLVVKHHILSRRFSSAFMLHSVACRSASVLRLNHENPKLCFLARESRRRLMWSLYMIDAAMARGDADLGLWVYREDSVRIQLPCNERNFEYDLPETTEPLQPAPGPAGAPPPPLADDVGFLALHIRIHLIRSRILRCTRRLLHGPRPTADELAALPGQFSRLAAELDAFAERLPASFRWSESNVRLRTYSPRLCVFFMTHILWEQCHCDLYRVVLPELLREALPRGVLDQIASRHPSFLDHCRRQAFEHTRAMAAMFGLLLTLDNGIPVTDLDLPACLYQCCRMLQCALGAGPDVSGMTAESVADLSGVCLRVLKQCVTTPASLGIVSRPRTTL